MSSEDAIAKIQRMARKRDGSVANDVKQKPEKHTPKPDFEEFTVETRIMPDGRIRFSPPKDIKKKLKKGIKIRLEVRLFSKHHNPSDSDPA